MDDQQQYIRRLIFEQARVFIYLISGVKLVGRIRGHDSSAVMVDNEFSQQLVYKRAISTIVPAS